MTGRSSDFPLEVELKLAFPPEARQQIEDHPAFNSPASSGPRTEHAISTYFDTCDLALAREGLSLRIRAKGSRRTQTLKTTTDAGDAATHRGEWEWSVATQWPNTALLSGTPAARYATKQLHPIVVTDIHRTLRTLTLEPGTSVEAAMDEGVIRVDDHTRPVHELELELKKGSLGALYRLALMLHADLPLRIETEAKATRGYHLRSGARPRPSKTSHPVFNHDIGAGEGFRQILAAGLRALLASQPAAAVGDPEGVHQMRIAVRRLRTALVLFRPHLEFHATGRFEDELRRLGQLLGEARDWDVFTHETLTTAAHDSELSLLAQLEPGAVAEQQASHHRLSDELQGRDMTSLALALAACAAEDGPLLDDVARTVCLAEVAPTLLEHLADKVIKRGRHITRLSGPELHRLRKSLKKLRYAVDDLASLYPKKVVKSFRKYCKRLQGRLGTINDLDMALTLVEKLPAKLYFAPSIAALGRWSEARQQKARRRLADDWNKFREVPRFWK